MVDIKPFLKRIFKQVKAGKKIVVASNAVYEGINYKVFTLTVNKSTMSEYFYNNLAEGYLSKLNDLPYIVVRKVEDGVFIHLFRYIKDEDDTIIIRQEIQEDTTFS